MTFVLLAILALLTVGLLLWPLARRTGGGDGVAVYRDQLDELERDRARGLIEKASAEAARTEIERRILAEAGRHQGDRPAPAGGAGPRVILALGVVALAVVLYGVLGSPDLPDRPLASRDDVEQPVDGTEEMQPLIARAEARVVNDPFDLEGWVLLANTYAFAERFDDAARAMTEALALDQSNADHYARFGEFVTLSRAGAVTPAARLAFAQALQLDPGQPVARYYEGVARAQDGDVAGALVVWRALLADSPPDAPWTVQLQRHIADAEDLAGGDMVTAETPPPGPTEEDIAAAAEMTADEQLEMIRGMVDGLAARLEGEPDNLEGWARLAQSYAVLGEWQSARDAYDHALGLAPGDPGLIGEFANAVMVLSQESAMVPESSVADMERVLAVQPENQQALYVTGLAAAQSGDLTLARERWTALRDLFPEDSNEHAQAQAMLDSLAQPEP